jgi:proline iminopeptidase
MHVAVRGTQLFYCVHGGGHPMLVMHGGLGWDHTYLRAGLRPLEDRVEVIYFDHRGNGRSERPESWEGITHDSWVEDAEALREHLGYERILLFGHSYGGFLAQEYVLRYPERVAGLILACTAPAMDFAGVIVGNAQARGTPEQVQAVLQSFSAPVPDDGTMARMMAEIFPLYFHGEDQGAALFAEVRYSAAAFNHAFGRCAPSFNTLERLGEIRAPTLILAGRHDWIMPPGPGAERLYRGIPGSELVVFEQSGHFPWHEEPERFADTVNGWLTRSVL